MKLGPFGLVTYYFPWEFSGFCFHMYQTCCHIRWSFCFPFILFANCRLPFVTEEITEYTYKIKDATGLAYVFLSFIAVGFISGDAFMQLGFFFAAKQWIHRCQFWPPLLLPPILWKRRHLPPPCFQSFWPYTSPSIVQAFVIALAEKANKYN